MFLNIIYQKMELLYAIKYNRSLTSVTFQLNKSALFLINRNLKPQQRKT